MSPNEEIDVCEGRALSAWRTAHAGVDETTLRRVRHAIAGAPLLHHRRWPEAMRGDTAAAVAVAVDVLASQGLRSLSADIAMSRVLLDAARHDPAAALVLAHAIGRLGPRAVADYVPGPTPTEACSKRSCPA